MKATNTLYDAIVYQLQRLRYTEAKVRNELIGCRMGAGSSLVMSELEKYAADADSKLLKLEHAFNYLMKEPENGKNGVIDKLFIESHELLDSVESQGLKDLLLICCLQQITAYKMSTYKTAYILAIEMDLDNVADLLHQILEWERETARALNAISTTGFNKVIKGDEFAVKNARHAQP